MEAENIRNVAIVAHVDHGKTTLVDELLRQSGQFRQGELKGVCILDSNPLERERGITILAKNCAIDYVDRHGGRYHINVVDTPGHADFSGEVERVLSMADGVLLLVDSSEGVMPQTRYVLGKALAAGLRPIVIINKMDRPDRRHHEVLEEVFNLLVDLGSDDNALDFPVLYASGRDGWAVADDTRCPADGRGDVHEVFDAIIAKVPPPRCRPDDPLQAQITTLDYNDYVGRIGIGRVAAGHLRTGRVVAVVDRRGTVRTSRIAKLLRFSGLGRVEAERIEAGDLFAVEGLAAIDIGDTITDPEHPRALPALTIDEPTLQMSFRVNDSPLAGREGTYVTSRQILNRLTKELQSNVALKVEPAGDEFIVSGRGLLHLGILIETMRREGYEMAVGKPRVILREDGTHRLEPMERLVVDVPASEVGPVMQLVGERRGDLEDMHATAGRTRMTFLIPARGLIGLRSRLLTATGGEVIMHHRFACWGDFRGELPGRSAGVLVATEGGPVTAYALAQLADRGFMFVEPGDEVYEGMVVGEHCKDCDCNVNVVRRKNLTNMRAASKDQTVVLKAPRRLELEPALEYIEDDELVEVTPKTIRLRKRVLSLSNRKRLNRSKAAMDE